MSGNADDPAPAAPRRKIQALSVSVNYADFLECIAPNIRHFDRWLIVTDERDEKTRDVCRRWGLEVLLSRRLYEGGAVFNKAAALNEGLEALDQDAWVAVMDSDILLPHDFRERLAVQELDEACLYGLSGRRICRTLPEFQCLAACEPWADNLIYTTFVIGYFNLFHLGQKNNRYPENASDDASAYDVIFSDSFPAARRRYLPMVCLHAGDPSINWRGRVADPFFEDKALAGSPAPESRTGEIATMLGGPGKVAAQIGCYHGTVSQALAAAFHKVIVIDHWGLLGGAPSAPLAADLGLLAARYAADTAGLPGLTPPLENSDTTLDSIPDGSLDAIWLTAEPEYDFLLNFLPAWLPRLRPGGAIVGGFYEPELLPVSSRVVNLLIGTPDETFPDRQWLRRIPDPCGMAARLRPVSFAGAGRGVVYVSLDESDVEALLVSISSLRRHWSGPVCVLSAGDESASLHLACVRMGVEFRNVPCVSAAASAEWNILHALDWSPFEASLFLDAATLVAGSPQVFFDALDRNTNAFCEAAGRSLYPVSMAAFAWHRDSPVPDAWRALASGLSPVPETAAVAHALAALRSSPMLHVIPAGPVWHGPVRRAPAGASVLSLARLTRGLHLFPPWAAEEQSLVAAIARDPA